MNHSECSSQKEAESQAKKLPSEFDVLCGQGRRNQAHAGNLRYGNLLSALEPAYLAAASNSEKHRIVRRVIDEIRSTGEFVAYDKKAARWHPVKDDDVVVKVAQALRYRKRLFKNMTKREFLSFRGHLIFDSLGSHSLNSGRMIRADVPVASLEIEPTHLQDMWVQPYVNSCDYPQWNNSMTLLTQRANDMFDGSTPFTREELSLVLNSALNEPGPQCDENSLSSFKS